MRAKRAVDAYLDAKYALLSAGYADEIDWQDSRSPERVDESTFLEEAAWVVLSTGFSEKVLRGRFDTISRAFLYWENAHTIVRHAQVCEAHALAAFNHRGKIHAITTLARIVATSGFSDIWDEVVKDPVETLRGFPYIGPVTSLHLAKNLGFDVAKPDRHLIRISKVLRFDCVEKLCRSVSHEVGDRTAVVDLVFWRFATEFPDYEERLLG